MNQEIRPLVVCNAAGAPINVIQENEKGYRKSLESGILWSIHPETGRLLPYAEAVAGDKAATPPADSRVEGDAGALATIEEYGTWYKAVLAPGSGAPETRASAPELGASAQPAEAVTADGSPSVPGSEGHAETTADTIGEVLTALATLIRERRRQMPEGSYTTHLFSAGAGKIRKKTGEEAVELILASDRLELTSETADFIYHLLVLLEVENISLDEVAAELKRR